MPRFRNIVDGSEVDAHEIRPAGSYKLVPDWIVQEIYKGRLVWLNRKLMFGALITEPTDWLVRRADGIVNLYDRRNFREAFAPIDGEDTAEDMPDIMRERHPDGSGGVKTLATFTARPRTCQGTYDEVMAARQRDYEERLSGGCA